MEAPTLLAPGTREQTEEKVRALLLRLRPDILFKVDLSIVFHRNRRTMISWSRKGRSGTLRLHEVFARAPEAVLEAIVRHFFTAPARRERARLRARIVDFVNQNRYETLSETSFPRVRPPRGKVYDLEQVRSKVTDLYVPEHRSRASLPRMGWSRRRTPSLMGKWIEGPPGRPNLIVINRLLDSPGVPSFYVEYIVFHEILHDVFPIRREAGRWVHHPVEFRRRERDFPHYREARRWEEEELPRLLSKHSLGG